MLDLAKKLKFRFMKSDDISQLCKKLEKEGYTTIIKEDAETTYNGHRVYDLYVFKDDILIIKIMYINRNNGTEYKQHILYYIY